MNDYSKEPTFKEMGLDTPITEFALALSTKKGDEYSPGGTAIIIAPNLAMTAKHVIEADWKRFESEDLPIADAHASFTLIAHQVLDEGKTGALWEITRLWHSRHTDISFLRLTPYSESAEKYKWRKPILNLAPPEIGSRVVGFGYHSAEMQDGTDGSVEWKVKPATTVGEVIDVKKDGKDPRYFVNARFENHMSGGPVFNDSGQLCGIIRSTLDKDTHVVSTLWPSMGTKIDINREGFPEGIFYPVLDLTESGHIASVNSENIQLIKDENGGIRNVGFKMK